MEPSSVIVVSCPLRAEKILQAGTMSCPACKGQLRPHGHGATRTVRGMGANTMTVTPRRARCADCASTHILLPTALTVRRADTTEVIGNALVAKAGGAGFRTIATRLHRPVSTVRRWLRRVPEHHVRPLGAGSCDRTPDGGNPLVPAAVNKGGEHVVEHPPVRDTSTVTPPRVGRSKL